MDGLNPQEENKIIGEQIAKKLGKSTGKEVVSEDSSADEKVIVIRHDNPKQELKLRERELFAASGNIDTVSRYLSKRVMLINQFATTVLIDREKMSIAIHSNENDFFGDKLSGKLVIHPDFVKFGINQPISRTTQQIADFFRMNRAFFPDFSENMKLVTVFKKFEASVDQKIKEIVENTGNKTVSREVVVNSTVPTAFTLNIPMFKGLESKTIEVETVITISNTGAIVVSLESPEAQEIMDTYKNEVIDMEIEKIQSVAPNVLIIEQ